MTNLSLASVNFWFQIWSTNTFFFFKSIPSKSGKIFLVYFNMFGYVFKNNLNVNMIFSYENLT